MKPSIRHPGAVLKQIAKELGMTQLQLAQACRTDRAYVCNFLNEHIDVTSMLALRLEDGTGVPALWWMVLQAEYDLERERRAPTHPPQRRRTTWNSWR